MGKRPANLSHDESVLNNWLRQDGTYKLVPNNCRSVSLCTQYPKLIEIPPKMWKIAEKLGELKQRDHKAVSSAHWPGDEHNMGNVAELMARAMFYKEMNDKDWNWELIYNPRYYRLKDDCIPWGSSRASVEEGGNPDWDLRIGPPNNFWRMEVKATGWGPTEKWVLRVKASEYNPHRRLCVLCTMMVDHYDHAKKYPKYMLPFHWVGSPTIDQVRVTEEGHPLAPHAACRILPFHGFTDDLVVKYTQDFFDGRKFVHGPPSEISRADIGPILEQVDTAMLRRWGSAN